MKNKISCLAPIEVKILVCRGSAHKIAMDSGTNVLIYCKSCATNHFYATKRGILEGKRQGFHKKL